MKSVLIVLMLAATFEIACVAVWDRLIVREENCDASDAALCLTSIFFIQPEHEDRLGIKEFERHYHVHVRGN